MHCSCVFTAKVDCCWLLLICFLEKASPSLRPSMPLRSSEVTVWPYLLSTGVKVVQKHNWFRQSLGDFHDFLTVNSRGWSLPSTWYAGFVLRLDASELSHVEFFLYFLVLVISEKNHVASWWGLCEWRLHLKEKTAIFRSKGTLYVPFLILHVAPHWSYNFIFTSMEISRTQCCPLFSSKSFSPICTLGFEWPLTVSFGSQLC